MFNNLIIKYSEKITIKDMKDFAYKNNIEVCDEDLNYIYKLIKTDINNILYDPFSYLEKIKDKLEHTTYLELKNLLATYSNFLYR